MVSFYSKDIVEYTENIIVQTILVMVAGFIAPIKTWIFMLEFFVLSEYITLRMLRNHQKRLSYFVIKAFLYIILLMQARAIEGTLFPNVPITQFLAASILLYQLKLNIKNVSEYAGVNLMEGITDTLQKLLQEMLKHKIDKSNDKP